MTIIDAFKDAENGALITTARWKVLNRFLKYMGDGVFYEYAVRNGKAKYLYEVRNFTLANILAEDWEIVENKYFKE